MHTLIICTALLSLNEYLRLHTHQGVVMNTRNYLLILIMITASLFPRILLPQESGRPLSLSEAVSIALERNPDLSAAREGYRSARWEARKAYLDYFPKVTLNADYVRMDAATVRRSNAFVTVGRNLIREFAPDQDPNDIRPMAYHNNYGTSFSVTQPVYNGGADIANISMAEAHARQEEYRTDEMRQRTILNVKSAFYDVLKAREIVAVRKATVRADEERVKQAQNMLEVGLRSRTDVLRWEVQKAGDEGNLVTAENEYEIALMNLKQILGVPLDERLLPVPVEAHTPPVATGSLEDNIRTALSRHPGIGAIEASTEASAANVRLAYSAFQPKINLVGSYGWETNSTIKLDAFSNWTAGVTISYPLFNSFSDYAKLQANKAREKQSEHVEIQYKRQLQVDVANATFTLRAADKRVRIAEVGIEQAEENLRVIRNKYDQGLVANIDFVDAQNAHTQAQVEFINARYDYFLAGARLELTMGILEE